MTFDKVNYLLGAYFHQDWYLESNEPDGIVEIFISKETDETILLLKEQIEMLLIDADSLNEDFIFENNGYYSPSADGLTVKEWFEKILKQLS